MPGASAKPIAIKNCVTMAVVVGVVIGVDFLKQLQGMLLLLRGWRSGCWGSRGCQIEHGRLFFFWFRSCLCRCGLLVMNCNGIA
jgi:hypothetical protein